VTHQVPVAERADKWISRAAGATVGGLAGIAGAISYSHMRQLAAAHGDAGWQPGSPGALLHQGPLRTAHATRRGTRPRQAAGTVQVFCCATVFPACRGGCLLRWQVACTRCVLLLRVALGVSWWTR
jgi:hypothetical protein